MLPVRPPLQPMLARAASEIPRGPGWLYEPKWDGFRAIAFLDQGSLHLVSRGQRPPERFFPELGAALAEALPRRCVVDGEVVVAGPAGLDGVVAKRAEQPYRPGERVMVKVKHVRTADCVLGGYRLAKDGRGVGSLLLGLYDAAGTLRYVGHTSGFTATQRRRLLELLAPLGGGEGFGEGGHRDPRSCTFDQLPPPRPVPLRELLVP